MSEQEYRDLSYAEAEQLVAEAQANEQVITLDRVGAAPYLKYTPYTNNSGVTVNMWSCISYTFTAKPDKTLLGWPKIVDPADHDSWEINMITTEWVIHQLVKSRLVTVVEKDDSPFAGDIIGGWND